jgi:hypothetical protein
VKNITVAVDEETYRQAKLFAAAHDTSVSALVQKHLQNLRLEDPWKKRRESLDAAFERLEGRGPRSAIGKFNRSEIYGDRLKLS